LWDKLGPGITTGGPIYILPDQKTEKWL
jgi:hypothetical protein